MKLAIIGGGGVRSIFLAKTIAQRARDLGITQLSLMDNDATKLKIYGRLAKETVEKLTPELCCTLTTDPVEAVRDADYIITTIRAGGDAMRVEDEMIALRAGVLGQETTGAAGFSFAMRSIPELLKYCGLIEKYARPGAKLFNFTNPAGLVSQALYQAGVRFAYGICDAPSGMLRQFANHLNLDAAHMKAELFGLNHFSWFQSIQYDGRELLPQLISDRSAYARTDMRYFDPELLQRIQLIPNEYLNYYYYPERALKNLQNCSETRAQLIQRVNSNMTNELLRMENDSFDDRLQVFKRWYGERENNYMAAETGIKRDQQWSFSINAPDDGGYAGVAMRYIEIINSGVPGDMILCVPNGNAIAALEPEDVIEATCTVSRDGCQAHAFPRLHPREAEWIRRMKAYERTAARAILSGSRDDAIDALMLHPLVNSYSIAKRLTDEYTVLNAAYACGRKP